VLRAATAFAIAKLRGFVAIILIARVAGVEQYGIWAQVIVVANLLGIVGGLGMSNALVRFYPDATTTAQRRTLLSSTWYLVAATAFAGAAIMFLSAPALAQVFGGGEGAKAFRVGALLVVGSELRLFFVNWMRARDDIAAYSRWLMIGEMSDLLCSTVALLLFGTITAALAGSAAALLAVTAVLAAMAAREVGGFERPSRSVRPILRYSLPLVPLALSDEALARSDRLVVGGVLGPTSAGTYSAIYALASTLQMLNVPLTDVLFPKRVRLDVKHPAGARRIMRKAVLLFGVAIVVESVVLAAVGPTLLRAMVDNPVETSRLPLVFLITTVGVGLYGIGRLLSLTMFVRRRTGTLALLWGSCLLLNLGANLVLVPLIGLTGAAASTVVSYGLFALLQHRLNRRPLSPPPDTRTRPRPAPHADRSGP
jgi:O-antigen/teichoic acid export membrane protein